MVVVSTPFGTVNLIDRGNHLVLQRHGLGTYRTAAAINHRANIAALREAGCDRALAICSVGGLREDLGVGTVVCPDDFIALQLGLSFSELALGERVPGFDLGWRDRVLELWRRHVREPIVETGTYWQAIGPRFETPAEIRLIASFADVVGMTLASECVLAGELSIGYAAICIVDNLANGVGGTPLAREDFEVGKALNRRRVTAALERLLGPLGGAA